GTHQHISPLRRHHRGRVRVLQGRVRHRVRRPDRADGRPPGPAGSARAERRGEKPGHERQAPDHRRAPVGGQRRPRLDGHPRPRQRHGHRRRARHPRRGRPHLRRPLRRRQRRISLPRNVRRQLLRLTGRQVRHPMAGQLPRPIL
ncbi:MAG: PhnB protein; putative DNA binding 3-demethylubiquinone-9 3-methyltransferase domain protein, partial [uncultured Thermomicrobiales bacterium]